MNTASSKRRGRTLALLLVGSLVGGVMLSPASAHLRRFGHLKTHMREVARKQATQRINALVPDRIQALRFDAVPAGTTIRGAVGGDFDAHTAAEIDWGVIVSLPVPASAPLSDNHVFINVAGWQQGDGQTQPDTTDTDPGCTGSPTNPTAPKGKVCIYVAGGDNASDVNGYSVLPGTGASPYGFKVSWKSNDTGDTFIDAVWAYTAN
jgi:hypothetical protein